MNLSRHLIRVRRQQSAWRRRFAPLLVLLIAIAAALPAPAAVGSSAGEGATLSATSAGGSAPELLQRLTIPQLAGVLGVTPEQFALQMQTAGGVLTGELAADEAPQATFGDLLNTLSAHGVSAAPVQSLVNKLLAGVTESPQQLQATVGHVLSDLAESGKLATVAKELGISPALLEGAQLQPSTAGQTAGALGTTTERLSSALLGSNALISPLTPTSRLVTAPVQRAGENGTSLLIGSPTGSGGLSLTLVSSTSTTAGAAAAAPGAAVSNAFSIVSVKVTRGGLILETVRLPGPGRLGITASVRRTVAARSSRGHRRTYTRNSTVAQLKAGLSGGQHTLTLRPKGVPGGHAAVVVNLATTYTPTGGVSRTIQRRVTERRAGRQRHR
jgi:hypothetical protein